MYELYYDEVKEAIYQVDPKGKKTIIADDFPSKPVFSPSKNKALYISPLEWECLGSVYLFNIENGYITEIVKPSDNQETPKYAIWIDEENIALIIGFGYGTVSIGGNVFKYNLTTQVLQQLTHYPPEIQVTKLELQENSLQLIGIQYIDSNFNEFEEFKDVLQLLEV